MYTTATNVSYFINVLITRILVYILPDNCSWPPKYVVGNKELSYYVYCRCLC